MIAISLHYFIDRNNNHSFIIPSKGDGVPMQNVYLESRLECPNRMRWPYIYVNSEAQNIVRYLGLNRKHLIIKSICPLFVIQNKNLKYKSFSIFWNTKIQRKEYIFYSIFFYIPRIYIPRVFYKIKFFKFLKFLSLSSLNVQKVFFSIYLLKIRTIYTSRRYIISMWLDSEDHR